MNPSLFLPLSSAGIADVGFLAGLAVDKHCPHLPLYRQHYRNFYNSERLHGALDYQTPDGFYQAWMASQPVITFSSEDGGRSVKPKDYWEKNKKF